MAAETRTERSRAFDYETIFILRADIDSDASEKAISRVVSAIEQNNGKLLKLESWGKRRLAFPVGKQRRGFYVYVRFLGYRGIVTEVERNLRLLDTVLRHMTVQLGKDIDPSSISVDPEEIKTRRIEITEGDESDREETVEQVLGLNFDDSRSERRERRDDSQAIDAEAALRPETPAPAAEAPAEAPAAETKAQA